MCVVKLDGDLIGKRTPVEIVRPEPPHEVGERAGYEKILLHKTQSLSLACVVVGIEHTGQRFGLERLSKRADEIAATELLKVEVIMSRCGPETECVNGL